MKDQAETQLMTEDKKPFRFNHYATTTLDPLGAGFYYRNGKVDFNTTDCSDPLTNGRNYIFATALHFSEWAPFFLFVVFIFFIVSLFGSQRISNSIDRVNQFFGDHFLGSLTEKKNYRPEIDGLRAIAVCGVMFFHFFNTGLNGGFLGVDIFFVISGYLITGIILEDLKDGEFTITKFYQRRIVRIFPALFTTIILVVIAGSMVLIKSDYFALLQSASWSSFFAANYYFMLHQGYFDPRVELQPLIHLWSLGIEEQFYIVWPLLLLLVWKFLRPSIMTVLIVVAVVFFVGLGMTTEFRLTSLDQSFYRIESRAFELALGALVVCLVKLERTPGKIAGKWLTGLGLLLIAFSYWYFSPKSHLPGWGTLVPIMATALILWNSGQSNLWTRILGLVPLRFIGKISFSLYLIHWPFLVLVRHYYNGAALNLLTLAWVAVGSFILASLSYYWIETPIRRHAKLNRRLIIPLGLGAVLMVIGLTLALNPRALSLRSDEQKLTTTDNSVFEYIIWENRDIDNLIMNPNRYPLHLIDRPNATYGFIIGDSHNTHFQPYFTAMIKDRNYPARFVSLRSCPAILNRAIHPRKSGTNYGDCGEFDAQEIKLVDYLNHHPEINLVVLSYKWHSLLGFYNSDELNRSVSKFISATSRPNRRFVLISDTPFMNEGFAFCLIKSDSRVKSNNCNFDETSRGDFPLDSRIPPIDQVFKEIAAKNPSVTAIIPSETLCKASMCKSKVDGVLFYDDNNHIWGNSQTPFLKIAEQMGLERVFIPKP